MIVRRVDHRYDFLWRLNLIKGGPNASGCRNCVHKPHGHQRSSLDAWCEIHRVEIQRRLSDFWLVHGKVRIACLSAMQWAIRVATRWDIHDHVSYGRMKPGHAQALLAAHAYAARD